MVLQVAYGPFFIATNNMGYNRLGRKILPNGPPNDHSQQTACCLTCQEHDTLSIHATLIGILSLERVVYLIHPPQQVNTPFGWLVTPSS